MISWIVLDFILVIYSNPSQLTPGCSRTGPIYEQSLSVLLSGGFLGIGSLVFSGTQYGVRSPCGVVHDKAWFYENNILSPKMGKIGQA